MSLPLYAIARRSVVTLAEHGSERFVFTGWTGDGTAGEARLEHAPGPYSSEDLGTVTVPLDTPAVVVGPPVPAAV